MAFPDIPTAAGSRVLTAVQANTTAARTFPNLSSLTKNAGDLLLAICAVYQSSAAAGSVFSSWGGSFTEFVDVGGTTSNMSIGCAYKNSTGSETGTFTVTQAATITGHAAMILMSISGWDTATPPVATAIANGTTAAADPVALSPAWGADDTLWISVASAGETGTAGAFDGLTTSPTNYSGDVISALSGDVVGGTMAGVAFRQLNTSSENVGTWTLDTSNARNSAIVIAVKPAPPVPAPRVLVGQKVNLQAVSRASNW